MQGDASIREPFIVRHLPLAGLAPPAPGVVHLWLLDLTLLGSPLPTDAAGNGKIAGRELRWLRRFYLRLLLGAYLGLPGKDVHIFRGARGKPRLHKDHHAPGLDFSMAASGSHCLIGVTSGALIGVDLEPRDRRAGKPLALARRYFHKQEFEALAALSAAQLDAAFLHTWACKEAVVKAAGMGIANALCRFAVDVRPEEPAAVLAMESDDPAAWRLHSQPLPGALVGALTVRFPTLRIEGFQLFPPA